MKSLRFMILTLGFTMAAGHHLYSQNNKLLPTTRLHTTMDTLELKHNKEAIQHLYNVIMNNRKFELIKDLVSEEFKSPLGLKGPEGFQQQILLLIKAFPDAQWVVEEMIAEGHTVIVRQRVEGTHLGQFQHIPATGHKISNAGISQFTFKEGKIISGLVTTDRIGFLQELGVLPVDLTTLPNKLPTKDAVYFIDRFFVPAAAKKEFLERMAYNRNFIKTLPGFIRDAAYESTDAEGNLSIVTTAVWENEEAVRLAKEKVQAEYKRIGFDAAAFYERLKIKLERGTYKELGN